MSTSAFAAWSFDEDEGWSVYLCRPVVILGSIYHPKASQYQMLLPKLGFPYNISF
jgi:hypothetical protein